MGKNPYNTTKEPYRLDNPYRDLTNSYRNPKLRQGYNSSAKARSYSPSRKKGGSSSGSRYTPRPAYRPPMRYQPVHYKVQPPPRAVASSVNPWTEPVKSRIPPMRYQPDIEKKLRQLEKRFDEKLEREVLERMRTEFEELKDTLKEKDETFESAVHTIEIEDGPGEPTKSRHEIVETADSESHNSSQKTFAETQFELNERVEDRTQSSVRPELAAKDTLHEIAEQTECPIEQVDEDSDKLGEAFESPERNDEFSILDELPEPIGAFEIPEQQTREIEPLMALTPSDTSPRLEIQPIDVIGLEQESSLMAAAPPIEPIPSEPLEPLEHTADLEILWAQIGPLETELMEPIEDMEFAEDLMEIFPEPMEDVDAGTMEADYW